MNKPEIRYTLECLPEEIPIRGNAMASGDDNFDRETENQIIADYESGNEWAWCCVKMTATCGGFEGTDFLSGCNYANEEDFRAGGYFEDMQQEAYADLLNTLTTTASRAQEATDLIGALS
jgi:hypothetical protein